MDGIRHVSLVVAKDGEEKLMGYGLSVSVALVPPYHGGPCTLFGYFLFMAYLFYLSLGLILRADAGHSMRVRLQVSIFAIISG